MAESGLDVCSSRASSSDWDPFADPADIFAVEGLAEGPVANGIASSVGERNSAASAEEELFAPALAKLDVRVHGLGGHICSVAGELSWTVGELKAAIEASASVPRPEQRLLDETGAELPNDALLGEQRLCGVPALVLEVTLLRGRTGQDYWLEEARVCGMRLGGAPEAVRADGEVVLAAVQQSGWALQYASAALRADRGVVLVAVRQDGRALQFAAPELQRDFKVVRAAVQQNGLALQNASDELRANREIVLAALRQTTLAVTMTDRSVWDDAEVQAAIANDERAKHLLRILVMYRQDR